MKREALSNKIMVVGVDGMCPTLTRKYVDAGKMPNVKKLIELGAAREDLMLLGSQPTVTPPQWTTLGTGANPVVHGVTQLSRNLPGAIGHVTYGCDSRNCKAEPIWNCFAEAGKKTVVFHWPGNSWPPTSDSENLMVIDGSSPGSACVVARQVDMEFVMGASVSITEATYTTREITDQVMPCVYNDLPDDVVKPMDIAAGMKIVSQLTDEYAKQLTEMNIDTLHLLIDDTDGYGTRAGNLKQMLANAVSPIKEPKGWVNAPEDAKEFVILLCDGKIRRVGLILKNEEGIYDHVAVYKSKKDAEPLFTCKAGEMVYDVVDDVIDDKDVKYRANRHYKLMQLAEDGTELKFYISGALDMDSDAVISPVRLSQALKEKVGPVPPQSQIYTQDLDLQAAMFDVWDHIIEWYGKVFDYLVYEEGAEAIFSHMHSVDLLEHTFVRYMTDKGFNVHPQEVYEALMEKLYVQVDNYYGHFLKYLEEDWTILAVSDHGQVCCTYLPPHLGDTCGCNVPIMEELGYTVLQQDENGNKIKKIDWSKTRAVQNLGNDIYINLKGREKNGIVDPADKYELEEQIITDLYGYKDPVTGKRVVALALRNKDAILLGYGGPTAGDICIWVAEGYNYDHTDSLSTFTGEADTSASPFFIAAGKGIKKGFYTDRIVRQVDIVPTVAILGGVRMPAQCEGAPIYQIFEEEF